MGGRLALVIGSECAALPELGFVHGLAEELYARLTGTGGWTAAVQRDGPVIDPSAGGLADAIGAAFDNAGERQASLLVAFIGHGISTGAEDFYLLAHDSPAQPDSRTAVHLTQAIRERLNRSALDGLVVLIDACEADQGVQGAARRWTDLLARSAGRVELLVASDDAPAYNGCFTKTMLATFDEGLALRGENLLPSDLVDPIAANCVRQRPQHLSYTMGNQSAESGGDPGLWLVPNTARRRDALTGRPAAGFVDHLTRNLQLTGVIRERLTAIIESGGHRLRAVVGPPAAGKSTLMALLIRPTIVDSLPIAPEYVTAAIFLTMNSSVDSVADELSAQLRTRLAGFAAAAHEASKLAMRQGPKPDVFDLLVSRPLAHTAAPGRRVVIVFDGLDQPEEGHREPLIDAIANLTGDQQFAHVRVVVSIRAGTGVEDVPALAHMHRITLPEPSARDIADILRRETRAKPDRYHNEVWIRWIDALLAETPSEVLSSAHAVAGGWLLARLLIEVDATITPAAVDAGIGLETLVVQRVADAIAAADPALRDAVGPLLGLLVAAETGPVLPIELLAAAMTCLGATLTIAQIRDLVAGLGVLVSRSRPGTAAEELGVTHGVLLPVLSREMRSLGTELDAAHRAILTAITANSTPRTVQYAHAAAVRHFLATGDASGAVSYLESTSGSNALLSRNTWATWLPSWRTAVGDEHPATLAARYNLAFWQAENHGIAKQLAQRRRRRPDYDQPLRPLPRAIEEDSDLSAIAAEVEQLLHDQIRVSGADHPLTLATRRLHAECRGRLGHRADAATDLEQVLADQLRILGADHLDTLETRRALSRCWGVAGFPARATRELAELLDDRRRVLGDDDDEARRIRCEMLVWLYRSGDVDGVIEVLAQLRTDPSVPINPARARDTPQLTWLDHLMGGSSEPADAFQQIENILANNSRLLGSETISGIFAARYLLLPPPDIEDR
ncbi:Nephrocystin-3 [Nocardia brasiliensis]|uniref:Nephrocystin-3 n=1 Tax=Nocardia brasiliensis (strain ATCC 700358 / HUJEG-1) TaxID=1133849 RepID=K0F2K3_NOCB7|nr:Nephrocystin-3 [Nocardia brasiliensis]AFU03350.1 Nephrocystin-3 [Nocardia brasiliensis ATCC 700358]OCF85255.1 hypothetical protein AW168_37555 [Nocardia brasiliensis]